MTEELWTRLSHVREVSIRQDFERYPEQDIMPEPEALEDTKARVKQRWAEAQKCS